MIKKTEGIVLRTIKHQDANVITTLYTKELGKRSFILKGYRSTRARSRHSYFQPLSIIEIVFQDKPGRQLPKVSESRISHLLHEVQTHPVKLSLGLAMMEIFFDTVKEEEENEAQYLFLKNLVLTLDSADKRLIHFFIYFLLHHTRFLGFFPHDDSQGSPSCTFNVNMGTFSAAKEKGERIAWLLREFMYSKAVLLPDERSTQQIQFTQDEKRTLIKTLFDYYQFHIEGFQYPQTMRVFAEIFG